MSRPDWQPAHRKLIVWQRSIELAGECYRLVKRLPPSERIGLIAQLRTSSASVHANIAEGAGRRTQVDFARFLAIARGSAMEVDSHTEFAVQVELLARGDVKHAHELAWEVIRMLSAMLQRFRPL